MQVCINRLAFEAAADRVCNRFLQIPPCKTNDQPESRLKGSIVGRISNEFL